MGPTYQVVLNQVFWRTEGGDEMIPQSSYWFGPDDEPQGEPQPKSDAPKLENFFEALDEVLRGLVRMPEGVLVHSSHEYSLERQRCNTCDADGENLQQHCVGIWPTFGN